MTKASQSGIAIGPILFIVAILAVLASAIAAGSGAFNSDTSAVKAKAQASAILEYANEVKFAVDRVRGHGCSDEQVSFENPIVSGYYTNSNAPSDKSCHVFNVNGGGIIYKSPPTTALDRAAYDAATASGKIFGIYHFSDSGISGIGSSNADLVMALPWISKDVCLQINKLVDFKNFNTTTPPNQTGWNAFFIFTGFYSASYAIAVTMPPGNVDNRGALQGCMDATVQAGLLDKYPGGGYFYFLALIVR